MARFLGLIPIAMTLVALAPSPALAGGTGYEARLATPPPKDRTVVHNLLWRCAGSHCIAADGPSRPHVVCEALARQMGAVTGFKTGGEALSAEQLARCNSAAGRTQEAAAR